MAPVLTMTTPSAAGALLPLSADWFRALAETTATAIFVYGMERFHYANRAAEELTGYQRGRAAATCTPTTSSCRSTRTRPTPRAPGAWEATPPPPASSCSIRRKDGEPRWLLFSAALIEWDGGPAGLGSAIDITERIARRPRPAPPGAVRAGGGRGHPRLPAAPPWAALARRRVRLRAARPAGRRRAGPALPPRRRRRRRALRRALAGGRRSGSPARGAGAGGERVRLGRQSPAARRARGDRGRRARSRPRPPPSASCARAPRIRAAALVPLGAAQGLARLPQLREPLGAAQLERRAAGHAGHPRRGASTAPSSASAPSSS